MCYSHCLMSVPEYAIAGKWMDYIRNYDLNDYAFGVSVSAGQNPYKRRRKLDHPLSGFDQLP